MSKRGFSLAFALALVVSVNSQCRVNIREQIPQRDPVYIQRAGSGFGLWAPDGPALEWQAGHQSFLVCSGSGNSLALTGTRDVPMTCQGGNNFIINGQLHPTNNVACTNTITGDITNTGAACTNGGTILNIGFTSPNYGFITYIQNCYNMRTGSVVYTRHTLPGRAITHSVTESSRPAFKSAGTPAHVSPAASYTQASQLARLTELLGSAELAAQYVFPNSFMARGHLAPDADGIFRSWQFSTYFFTNVAPQWQAMNNGNWLRIENAVRTKAAQLQEDVIVYTGVHDVLTLNNIHGQPVRISLEPNGNIEVPRWYWKIIRSPRLNAGIAFMSLNNPFATSFNPSEMLCQDICQATGWHHANFADFGRGLTFCCSVPDFMRTVSAAPAEAFVNTVLPF